MDPLAGSSWSTPDTVAGFVRSPPNERLLAYADALRPRLARPRLVDIGCGAGRNAVPLAEHGWTVTGTDLSWPMLQAAAERVRAASLQQPVSVALAPMEALPFADRAFDLVVAHGIWNLARSAAEFRHGVREAARVARDGAALFVFTFSRHTIPPDVSPVPGEPFVYTAFSGQPQCFLTERQLLDELREAGFVPDPDLPTRELNLPRPGEIVARRAPVIFEGGFRRTSGLRG